MKSLRVNTFFFQKTKLEIRMYLFSQSHIGIRAHCTTVPSLADKRMAINWASYLRELFKEYFQRHVHHKRIHGIVETHESLFGRWAKYHKGNSNKGMKIWIFGFVCRENNTGILYPVGDGLKETLKSITECHIAPGAKIFSDSRHI